MEATMLSQTLSVLLVVYFSFDPSYARADNGFVLNNYNYIEAVDSYYKIHPTRRTFADAKQTCAQEGATLFYPENKKEAHAVIELWNKYQPYSNWAVYVGLTDREREGSYKTLDGRPISNVYQRWKWGEPNNNGPGDEDCATLYRQGDMNDVPCTELYPFICKKKNNNYEYEYIAAVDSYYKIHTTRRTFAEAKQTCIQEGATLFYPENKKEAHAAIEFGNRYQPNTNWAVYVGLTDMEREGTYKTLDGRPISNVYQRWQWGEPNNNGPGDEDCATLYRQGDMNDVPCTELYPFICKKKNNNYEYIAAVDSYYKIHTTRRTFADAKQTCIQEGATLFYPEDKKEAHAVIEFGNRYQPNTNWAVYVGLTDMEREGTYKTLDGRPISNVYQRWQWGEPNNNGPGDEDCATLYRQGDMNDVPCTELYPFICKRFGSKKKKDHCNSDYIFSENVGNCYKLHTTPLTWIEAFDVCHSEHSHLAVINNALEADYLAKLMKSVAKQGFGGIYHLGIHSVPNHGWQTVTGQSISHAGALWGNFVPTAEDDKQCGSMSSSGLLSNIDCSTKTFFICERVGNGPTESTFSFDNEENYA